jgi:hypothetical protein
MERPAPKTGQSRPRNGLLLRMVDGCCKRSGVSHAAHDRCGLSRGLGGGLTTPAAKATKSLTSSAKGGASQSSGRERYYGQQNRGSK